MVTLVAEGMILLQDSKGPLCVFLLGHGTRFVEYPAINMGTEVAIRSPEQLKPNIELLLP